MLYLKFNGAGWLFSFYIGVAQCLREYIDIKNDKIKIAGVSAGSIIATLLILELDFNHIYEEIIAKYEELKYNPFKMKNILHDVLLKYISENDNNFMKLKDKLTIGVSALDILRFRLNNHEINTFENSKNIIDAIKASCHIPIISGILPYIVNNKYCYDGEMTKFPDKENMNNIFIDIRSDNSNKICPGIKLPEIWIYYPSDVFIMKSLHKLGYYRTQKYIFENNKIFKPYLKKQIKNIDIDNLLHYQQIIEYSIRTKQISILKSPLYTLVELINKKNIFYLCFLIFLLRRINIIKYIIDILRKKNKNLISFK